MEKFVLNKTPKVYFGENALKETLDKESENIGSNVLIAYGGGSVKENNIFDSVKDILIQKGKKVFEFGGIMSNPPYAKVQEGAKIAKENNTDFIIAVGGGSVADCCKMISARAKTDEEVALLGIESLENFIKEIGLPTTLKELNITDVDMLKKVAFSSNITNGCCKKLIHEEIFEILKECL